MPLFWLSIALITGIITAAKVYGSGGGWAGGLAGSLILFGAALAVSRWRRSPGVLQRLSHWLLIRKPEKKLPIILLCFAFALGGFLYTQVEPPTGGEYISSINDSGRNIQVVGLIDAPPERRERVVLTTLAVEQWDRVGDRPRQMVKTPRQRLMLFLPLTADVHYGDRVLITGYPSTPFEDEDFSYREYLAIRGIHSLMRYPSLLVQDQGQGSILLNALYTLRYRMKLALMRSIPAPENALVTGIVLGDESAIPEGIQNAFRQTGTAHIIAISGFNIALLAGIITRLFSRILGRWRGAAAAIIGIVLYAILVGGSASVVRAAIMGSLAIAAQQIGRKTAGVNALVFTAGVMALFNPLILWDAGFQLSFSATLGLILFADRIQALADTIFTRFLKSEKGKVIAGFAGEYFLYTLVVYITAMPVMLALFNNFSVSAFITNPIILPVQPALMILGGLTAITGVISPAAGVWLGTITYPFAAYTIHAVQYLAALDFPVITWRGISPLIFGVYYATVFLFTFNPNARQWFRAFWKPSLTITAAALAAVLLWMVVLQRADGRLRIIIPAAQDSTILINGPGGEHVLLNGGRSINGLANILGRSLPFWDKTIDLALIASGRMSDIGSLEYILPEYIPDIVFWATEADGASASQLHALAAQKSWRIVTPLEVSGFRLSSGVEINMIQREVYQVTWQQFRLMIVLDNRELRTMVSNSQPGILWYLTEHPDEDQFAALRQVSPQLMIYPDEAIGNAPNYLNPKDHEAIILTSDGTHLWTEVE